MPELYHAQQGEKDSFKYPMNISQWIIAHFLEIAGYLLAIILIPCILLERRHPGATVFWLLDIGLIPFIGVPLYFLSGYAL